MILTPPVPPLCPVPLPVQPLSSRHHVTVLAGIALCVVPSMALVGLGQFQMGAYVLFVTLLLILAYLLVSRRGLEALTIAVATIPVVMLLRGMVLYNSLQVILAACLACALASPLERSRMLRNRTLAWFVGLCLSYWLASFIATGEYFSNFRMVELALAAAAIAVLCGHRSYLACAMLGVTFSALAMAAGLLPHGDRLGIASAAEEITVGNPITLGLSASLGFLLSIADGGRWILLHRRLAARLILNMAAGAALVLSTSRGSWLVAIAGACLIVLLNRPGRRTLLGALILLSAVIVVILQTGRGPVVQHYFQNAVGDDRSLDKRTTGRADQWESFPHILEDSPLWGFGPGSGKAVSLKYTKEGKPWHSLYLLIGVEAGLAGLAALALLLSALAWRAILHRRKTGEVVPLMGLTCLLFIGVSVSGLDAISGVFLGLAFAGGDYSAMARVWVGNSADPSFDGSPEELTTGAGP